MLLIAVERTTLATVRPLLAEQRWLRGNWLAVNHAGPAVGRIVKSMGGLSAVCRTSLTWLIAISPPLNVLLSMVLFEAALEKTDAIAEIPGYHCQGQVENDLRLLYSTKYAESKRYVI